MAAHVGGAGCGGDLVDLEVFGLERAVVKGEEALEEAQVPLGDAVPLVDLDDGRAYKGRAQREKEDRVARLVVVGKDAAVGRHERKQQLHDEVAQPPELHLKPVLRDYGVDSMGGKDVCERSPRGGVGRRGARDDGLVVAELVHLQRSDRRMAAGEALVFGIRDATLDFGVALLAQRGVEVFHVRVLAEVVFAIEELVNKVWHVSGVCEGDGAKGNVGGVPIVDGGGVDADARAHLGAVGAADELQVAVPAVNESAYQLGGQRRALIESRVELDEPIGRRPGGVEDLAHDLEFEREQGRKVQLRGDGLVQERAHEHVLGKATRFRHVAPLALDGGLANGGSVRVEDHERRARRGLRQRQVLGRCDAHSRVDGILDLVDELLEVVGCEIGFERRWSSGVHALFDALLLLVRLAFRCVCDRNRRRCRGHRRRCRRVFELARVPALNVRVALRGVEEGQGAFQEVGVARDGALAHCPFPGLASFPRLLGSSSRLPRRWPGGGGPCPPPRPRSPLQLRYQFRVPVTSALPRFGETARPLW